MHSGRCQINSIAFCTTTLLPQLNRERQRNAILTNEVAKLRVAFAESNSAAEVGEERVVNRMIGRLSDLRKEKEAIALEVEREEELLTNTLSRRLGEALRVTAAAEAREAALREEVKALRAQVRQLTS